MSLGVASHLSTALRWGNPLSALLKRTTSKLAGLFSTLTLFDVERQAGKL